MEWMMKKPLSFEEHQDRGLKLQQAFEFVQTFAVEIANTYGLKTKAAKSLFKAVDDLRASKCALDDIVCRDYRDEPREDLVRCYYAHDRAAGSKTTPR
jgi:hypothetical protein